jgi:hypothetical protein
MTLPLRRFHLIIFIIFPSARLCIFMELGVSFEDGGFAATVLNSAKYHLLRQQILVNGCVCSLFAMEVA